MNGASWEERQVVSRKLVTKIAIVGTVVILFFIAVFAVGCPQYRVYRADKQGEAQLKEAENAKLVEIEEARAHLEAEKLNAQSEVERAKGVAESIAIEGGELTDRYIQYLWVREHLSDEAQVIYVPTETNLPLLEAGRRP